MWIVTCDGQRAKSSTSVGCFGLIFFDILAGSPSPTLYKNDFNGRVHEHGDGTDKGKLLRYNKISEGNR